MVELYQTDKRKAIGDLLEQVWRKGDDAMLTTAREALAPIRIRHQALSLC